MSKKIRTEAVDHLFDAILSLENKEECYQFFVPGRACMLKDIGFDALGAAVGVTIGSALFIWWDKRLASTQDQENIVSLQRLHEKVTELKHDREWEGRYMTVGELIEKLFTEYGLESD